MAIWLDMTKTLITHKYGVVGVVRAELEIAKNMKKLRSDTRFCTHKNGVFTEITDRELNWLWESERVVTAYLDKFGRNPDGTHKKTAPKKESDEPDVLDNGHPRIAEANAYSPLKVKRLYQAVKLFIEASPIVLRPLLFIISLIAAIPFGVMYMIFRPFRILYLNAKRKKAVAPQPMKHQKPIVHPFCAQDKILCVGSYSENESDMERLKEQFPEICIIYAIYDLSPLNPDTSVVYRYYTCEAFKYWLERRYTNCDYLLYGGQNSQNDSERYQRENGFPLTPGFPVFWGSEVYEEDRLGDNIDAVKRRHSIKGKYILSVGSFAYNKNYETLYRAYAMLDSDDLPHLVIIGKKNINEDGEIVSGLIQQDPNTESKISIVEATDEELNLLYKNCEFTLLPSLCEGWSLTLPEALAYGKICVCVDLPCNTEIAGDVTLYVQQTESRNPKAWIEAITSLYKNPVLVKEYEKRIQSNYHVKTWEGSARRVLECVDKCNVPKVENRLFVDLTLSAHEVKMGAAITGIPRVETILSRYIGLIRKDAVFFAADGNGAFFTIPRSCIVNSRDSEELRVSLKAFLDQNTSPVINTKTTYKQSFWMLVSVIPFRWRSKFHSFASKITKKQDHDSSADSKPTETIYGILGNVPFSKSDIVFSAGIFSVPSYYKAMIEAKKTIGFKFVQIMYDFTPMLTPQTHTQATIKNYAKFTEYVTNIADLILYGGATAQRDGEAFYKMEGYNIPAGIPLKFGSDFTIFKTTPTQDKKMLEELGADEEYIVTVGTWQYRKNITALYNAYIRMIELGRGDELPQLIVCGRPGWKTEHLIDFITRDKELRTN